MVTRRTGTRPSSTSSVLLPPVSRLRSLLPILLSPQLILQSTVFPTTTTASDGYMLDLSSRWGVFDVPDTLSSPSDHSSLPHLHLSLAILPIASAPSPPAHTSSTQPGTVISISRQTSKLVPGTPELIIVYSKAEEAEEALRHFDGGFLFGSPL